MSLPTINPPSFSSTTSPPARGEDAPPGPVLLGDLELRPANDADVQVRVHAFVSLGPLRAADVDVALHFDRGAQPSIPSAAPSRSMWSESVSEDGWYRYAALLRREEMLGASRLHVRVRARRDPASSECLASGTLLLHEE